MPAAPLTTPDLFTLIQRRNIVPHERLQQYLHDKPLVGMPALAEESARRLVKDGLLSDFQAQLLLLGNPEGLTLGRYQLTDLIGRGGMSSVFLAHDTRLGRNVAVKVFTLDSDEKQLQKRFEREAHAAATIAHPNVVKAFDYGDDGRLLYFVMEHVPGTDLHKLVKRNGALPVELACHYAKQASDGLAAVHTAGLIHRDVKPSNFLASNDGTIKLCDLGIVRVLAKDEEPITELHLAGSFLGTPQFLAPEQLENSHTADERADVYGLGATLYYLLTAKPPRRKMLGNGSNVLTKPTAILQRRPDLPPALATYIDTMLADNPEDRPKRPKDVAKFLSKYAVRPSTADSANRDVASNSAPTAVSSSLRTVRGSSMNFMPVTESTPTLPFGAIPSAPAPGSRRIWLTTGLIAVLVLACAFLAVSRGKPTQTLEEQVKQRIMTDKAMSGATVNVLPDVGGRVILTGSVGNSFQKQKAVSLAEHTTGVEAVKDELAIR